MEHSVVSENSEELRRGYRVGGVGWEFARDPGKKNGWETVERILDTALSV